MSLWDEQFQTTISSSMQLGAEGAEVEEAVKRSVETLVPTLVEESVKRGMQTFMLPLVEDAVRKGIQASTPILVEEVLHKGMQTLIPLMAKEMRKMFVTAFPPPLQSSNQPSSSRPLLHMEDSHESRNLQLHFELQSQSCGRLYTGKKLKEQGILFKVYLRDEFGKVVEGGAESSVKIKIVVLQSDYSVEDGDDPIRNRFHEHVLQQREDKPPLLVGNFTMALNKGVADVDDIAFTDNSSWVRNKKFRLGAEVVKSVSCTAVTIKEAVSEAFEVKERRGESYQKKKIPALDDDVWRLNNIAKDGKIDTRLKQAKIISVNDLLQRYHADEAELKNILQVSNKKFQAIVKHAKSANSNIKQPRGDLTAVFAGKDLNELSNIGQTNYSLTFQADSIFSTAGSSANILNDVAVSNLGNSEMQLPYNFSAANRTVSQQEVGIAQESSSEHLDNLTPDSYNRFQELMAEVKACIRSSNKPRWRSVGAALRFSVFRFVIIREASRARKRQRVR